MPAEPQRRFLRVTPFAIDTNNNNLPDWWELQYGYQPFSLQNQPGYAGETADDDGDGLTNGAEFTAGTDPHNPDTDGDLSPDGEEVDKETDPLDPDSTPTVLVSTSREMHANMFYETADYHWAIFGYRV